jgi:hypothetical protein
LLFAVSVGVAGRRGDRRYAASGPMCVLLVPQQAPAHAQFVVWVGESLGAWANLPIFDRKDLRSLGPNR